MKKLFIIFTAVFLAMPFSAASAAGQITPEEVKAFIMDEPLSERAECDELINMIFYEPDDILEQSTISGQADPARSVRAYYLYDDDFMNIESMKEIFIPGGREGEIIYWYIDSLEDENAVFEARYTINGGSYSGYGVNEIKKGTEYYDELYFLEYEKIAGIINSSDIGEVKDIKALRAPMGVYIETDRDEYILLKWYGKTGDIEYDKLMTCGEYMAYIREVIGAQETAKAELYEKVHERMPEIAGWDYVPPEPPETDSLAPYRNTASKFADVTNEKMIPYINMMADRGVVTGYEDGLFYPDREVTKMEAAMMITRLMDFPLMNAYRTYFFDIPFGDDRERYLVKLADYGIIHGDENRNFNPGSNMDFNQLFKICCALLGMDKNTDPVSYLRLGYPIGTNRKALELGLDENLDIVDMNKNITRGEIAVVLGNLLDAHMTGHIYTIDNGAMHIDDITLAAYLEGEEPIGDIFFPSQYEDWWSAMKFMFKYKCGDLLDEFVLKTGLQFYDR